jgi:hypothetical protein
MGDIWYPDDGGDIIPISGPWAGSPMYFRVRVRHVASGTIYPNDSTKSLLGLPGARPGSGETLLVYPDGTLRFALCPLQLGTYDILVYYGPSFTASPYVIEDAFEIVYRHLCRESWNIRRKFPKHWFGANPRSLTTEPVPANNVTFPQTLLRSLTAAIGEQIQFVGGKAVTRTTADVEDDDTTITVETTLGFTDNGTICVGDREYGYTGRTPTTFTGVFAKFVYEVLALPAGSMVVSKPADWLPED